MKIAIDKMECANCGKVVSLVDPYGGTSAYDEGIVCANCGAYLDCTLAELAARAPTTMDNRVCRSVAVQSHGLSEALRARGCGSDNAIPNAERERLSDLHDRFSEFNLAVSDFDRHIHLL